MRSDGDDAFRPFPRDDVMWEGRPSLGLHRPDHLAALASAVVSFPVLALGLWGSFGVEPSRALQLGGLHAGLVGVAVGLTRAIGAGPALVPCAAFALSVLVAAALATDKPGTLTCAASFAGAIGGALFWRWKQRSGTRYQIGPGRVAVGERGRYTIVFPILGAPTIRPDRFGGSLVEVEFPPAEARLTTRLGQVFKLPAQRRRFLRVSEPERLKAALAAATTPRST